MRESLLIDGKLGTGIELAEFLRGDEMASIMRVSRARVPMITDIDIEAAPAVARVNLGRWITDCPQPRCPGTSFVWINGPRQFFCPICGNRGIGGRFRLVDIPDDWEMGERVLVERHIFTERNWTPAETVIDLAIENLEGGYNVPAEILEAAQTEMRKRSRRRDLSDPDAPPSDLPIDYEAGAEAAATEPAGATVEREADG